MGLVSFRVMAAKDEYGSVTVLSLADAELAERARAAADGLPVEPVRFPLPGTKLGIPVRMKTYMPGNGGEIIDVGPLGERRATMKASPMIALIAPAPRYRS
jgi:hypothetical protein